MASTLPVTFDLTVMSHVTELFYYANYIHCLALAFSSLNMDMGMSSDKEMKIYTLH